MLLNMKAMNEAGRAFSTYVAMQLDVAKFSESNEEKKQAAHQVSLLTPVAKAFFTDIGLESCVAGQQVFGGHGYIREWGQEQLVRDVRIAQIYEGTNGIQALDLLDRKITRNGGTYFKEFVSEIRKSLNTSQQKEFVEPLSKALERLDKLTGSLMAQAKDEPNAINAACVEYLHAFSYVTYGWMWLLMADEANKHLLEGTAEIAFYQAKVRTARYYFKRLLPRLYSLADAAEAGAETLYAMDEKQF